MLMPRFLLSAVVMTLLAACQAPAPEAAEVDVAALRDAVQAREKEWSAAFLAADAAAIAALYTEDAASIPATGDWSRGREGIARLMQLDFDSTNFSSREDITEEVIPIAAAYIFEVGHYASSGTSKADGKPKSESGRYVVLWRKDADGAWRILRDMGTEAAATP